MGEDIKRGRAKTNNPGGSKMMQRIKCKELFAVIIVVFFLIKGTLFAQEQEVQKMKNDPVAAQEKEEIKVESAPTQKEEIKNEPQASQEEKTVEKLQFQEKPAIKGYTYNLKRLLEQAQENVKKIDEEIKQAEIKKCNEEREAKVIEHFEKGNQLYQEGKLKEAKEEWQKALEVSQDPEMREYIKESEKRAREEELARKKEEQERQKRLEAEAKEKERLEKEKQKQLELEQKEKEHLEKEKQKQLEAQRKEEERKQKEAELAKKKAEQESARQEKLKQAELKKQQEEQARLEAEKKHQQELACKEAERKQQEEQARIEKQKKEEELTSQKAEKEH